MDNRPIGVFDSGVGGLTAVRELRKILPGEDIVYFGDTGRVPYGSRSKQTIVKFAVQNMRYLLTHDVKVILAACGTVCTNVTEKDIASAGIDAPYHGIVMPATRAACAQSQGGRIGVMATMAAIRSGAYGKALRTIQPSAQLIGNAAPLLVPIVENGMTEPGNPITRQALEYYLAPFIREEVDTLILGCTHYPILYDMINEALDYKVSLVDAGAAAAHELKVMLWENDLLAARESGCARYIVTDTVDNFVAVARNFLFEDIESSTQYVDIDDL
ncbi:MAG: glutamate racemase [Oscillospiraceae bacterium]|nr:glutamate racemase [Oscillospiraceae bacterium]